MSTYLIVHYLGAEHAIWAQIAYIALLYSVSILLGMLVRAALDRALKNVPAFWAQRIRPISLVFVLTVLLGGMFVLHAMLHVPSYHDPLADFAGAAVAICFGYVGWIQKFWHANAAQAQNMTVWKWLRLTVARKFGSETAKARLEAWDKIDFAQMYSRPYRPEPQIFALKKKRR